MSEVKTLLRTESLTIGYGTAPLIRDVNVRVSVGEIVGLIGTNGSGKSTLLRTVAGLLPNLAGTIELNGQFARRMPVWRRIRDCAVAYLPQGKKNFSNLTTRENLHLALWKSSDDWAKRERRIAKLLKGKPFDALSPHLNEFSAVLSGGEDLLLGLAKCLLLESKLLLLDEPSAGLSESTRLLLVDLLKPLQQNAGILLVEQSLNTVFALAARVYVIRAKPIGPSNQIVSSVEQLDEHTRRVIRDHYGNGNPEKGAAEVAAILSHRLPQTDQEMFQENRR